MKSGTKATITVGVEVQPPLPPDVESGSQLERDAANLLGGGMQTLVQTMLPAETQVLQVHRAEED